MFGWNRCTYPRLFAYYKETGKLPTTSAPTPAYYEDFYKKWTDEGFEVVHLSISGEMTVTPNIARMAAENFRMCIPSIPATFPAGWACWLSMLPSCAIKGFPERRIADKVREQSKKVRTAFVISTLLYMYKGGRCTGVQMLGANLLNLKPCIEVQDGKMGVTKKYRGNLESVVCQMITDKLTNGEKLNPSRIMIAHYDAGDKVLAAAQKKIRELASLPGDRHQRHGLLRLRSLRPRYPRHHLHGARLSLDARRAPAVSMPRTPRPAAHHGKARRAPLRSMSQRGLSLCPALFPQSGTGAGSDCPALPG